MAGGLKISSETLAPMSQGWLVEINGVEWPALNASVTFQVNGFSMAMVTCPYDESIVELPYGSCMSISVKYGSTWYLMWGGIISSISEAEVVAGDMVTIEAMDYWGMSSATSLVPLPSRNVQFLNIGGLPAGDPKVMWEAICDRITETMANEVMPAVITRLGDFFKESVHFHWSAEAIVSSMMGGSYTGGTGWSGTVDSVKRRDIMGGVAGSSSSRSVGVGGATSAGDQMTIASESGLFKALANVKNHWQAIGAIASFFNLMVVPHAPLGYDHISDRFGARLTFVAPGYYDLPASSGALAISSPADIVINKFIKRKNMLPFTRYVMPVPVANIPVYAFGPTFIRQDSPDGGREFGGDSWLNKTALGSRFSVYGTTTEIEDIVGIRPLSFRLPSANSGVGLTMEKVKGMTADELLSDSGTRSATEYARMLDIMFYMKQTEGNKFNFQYLFNPFIVPGFKMAIRRSINEVAGYGIVSSVSHSLGTQMSTGINISNYMDSGDADMVEALHVKINGDNTYGASTYDYTEDTSDSAYECPADDTLVAEEVKRRILRRYHIG